MEQEGRGGGGGGKASTQRVNKRKGGHKERTEKE